MADTRKMEFTGALGDRLAALLDRPSGAHRAVALFAHCFTCSKDVFAAKRIADGLAERGFAVLRFDFTGLGASGGEFANTNFSSNVADLLKACDHLRAEGMAPSLLIGHSLGGAAVLAAAGKVPEVKAVATIAAPADPSHVVKNFHADRDAIERDGEAEVILAGRKFRITRQFLEDIGDHNLADAIGSMGKALMIFHSPTDDLVGIENAERIYRAAKHPKSFCSLDGADHLLTDRSDADYVADVLAAWAQRYLPRDARQDRQAPAEDGTVIVRETGSGRFQQEVLNGAHRLLADEPAAMGGDDTGPSPYGYLLAALGSCTSMTVRMYADRKKWPLDRVAVHLRHEKIHAEDCADCETRNAKVDVIDKEIRLSGALDDEQRRRLIEIAERCPVNQTLQSEIRIRSSDAS